MIIFKKATQYIPKRAVLINPVSKNILPGTVESPHCPGEEWCKRVYSICMKYIQTVTKTRSLTGS